MSEQLLSLQQAAKQLGVSYWTARHWVHAGILVRVNLPAGDGENNFRKILIHPEDVARLIAANRQVGNGKHLSQGQDLVDTVLPERSSPPRIQQDREIPRRERTPQAKRGRSSRRQVSRPEWAIKILGSH